MTVSEKNKNAVEHKKQSIYVQTPVNSTVAINSSKKSQSEPESIFIIKEKNPKIRLLTF